MTNYLISQDDRNYDDSGKDYGGVILSSIKTRGMELIMDKISLGVMILDKNLSRSDNGEKPEMEAGSEKNYHC